MIVLWFLLGLVLGAVFERWFGGRTSSRRRTLGAAFTEFHGRFPTMAALDPVTLFDSEKAMLTVAPRLPNGDPDTTVEVSVTSSDSTQVGVEQIDARNWWITTPLDSGSATLTLDAPGYEADTLAVSYSPGLPRRLNVTVGAPVSDIE